MKTTSILAMILIAAVAAAGGWFAARTTGNRPTQAENGGERKVLFYQSAMHPWIKADRPGTCTICGMKLTPVYEGDQAFDLDSDIISLSPHTINVLHVQSQEVQRRPLTRTLRVAGTIDDNDAKHRFVSAYVDGRIEQLFVNYVGAEVVAGEPLAAIFSPALLTAEREYLTLLRQPEGSAALQEEKSALLAAARERLRRLGLTEAQIEELADKDETAAQTIIRSPVTGTVVERFTYEGLYVKEGDRLFALADFSTMWFIFDAYERDLAWIRPGQKVDITTPAVPGKTFHGAITFIDPNLREATRSARVRVELENPLLTENGRSYRELLHRLYADGRVHLESPEVLAIPRTAVISPGGTAVAYVDLGEGMYEQRRLKLGRSSERFWEVLEGVEAGERVVTTGNLLMDAQAQINQSVHGTGDEPAATAMGAGDEPAGAAELEELTSGQRASARAFLQAMDGLSHALAADDLAAYNTQAEAVRSVATVLHEQLHSPGWAPVTHGIHEAAQLPPADTLETARRAFLPLSTGTVAFARVLREADPEFAPLKIYVCPMTNRAFEGAPRTAQWVQLDAPLRNPYFGDDMLECGREVQ